MLFATDHVRVTAECGTATLWLDFPGDPPNALDLARLRAIDRALAVVEASKTTNILVVRSAKAAGFCVGLHPAALASLTSLTSGADRAGFAWVGQQVLRRLSKLDATTVAFIDGPCLGAGLELALACDYRLCLSRSTTYLGFPDAHTIPPCFGGTSRPLPRAGRRAVQQLLASGQTLSGREARAVGLVDHAFCDRRGKIELQTFLDWLERRAPCDRQRTDETGAAAERQAFAEALGAPATQREIYRQLASLRPVDLFPPPINPIPPFPAVVGLVGEAPGTAGLAAEVALRGGEVVVRRPGTGVRAEIAVALTRGFITPLEAEQANTRVTTSNTFAGFDRAGLVLVAPGESPRDLAATVGPRCVVAMCEKTGRPLNVPHPRRVVGLRLGLHPELIALPGTDSDTLTTLATWLRPFGWACRITGPVAGSVRAAA